MNLQSSSTEPPTRFRRKHQKTRTGCVTCKARRLKCDERPGLCRRCESSGTRCFYRPQPQGYLTGVQRDESIDVQSVQPVLELAISSIERTPETTQLQQFCMSTSLAVFKNLGRPFETFWTSAVPKLSIYEPCVAHVMVALAARQRASFYANHSAVERTQLIRTYNKHYTNALNLLTKSQSASRPEIILLCCLMFISMENVEDTISNSFLHLRSGLQVLREWKASRLAGLPAQNSAKDLIERTLEPIFARFEAAVSPSIYHKTIGEPPTDLRWPMPSLPGRFESLAAARGVLYEIAQWVFSQGQHQMIFQGRHTQEIAPTLDLCLRWKERLNKYNIEHPREAQRYKTSILALETNHQLLTLLTNCTALPNEHLWTRYSAIHEEMFKSIQYIEQQGLTELPQRRSKMSLLPRMMPALFTIAVIYRRRATQKQALEMIKRIHAENHPDQCFVAVIAETLIQREEALEQESIMQLASMATRVRPLKAELIPGWPGQILLTYTRPFVRSLVAEDPNLGPIVSGAPTTTIAVPWRSEEAPPARVVWLWPVVEFLRLSGSGGLVGPNTGHCLCKTYGALFALMR
ncbi:hypothetical protein LTS08_008279 [Lithohypha guttulata]|uniref:Zn(2)-C6 fungal-type domain-containing protein n=1 Tax=Lithohypha guttulata TaxID=1690604 RepID=A0AAN7T156_9EURO|nr:hypothetical protein LTR05_004040 [Lithohypha guttulata]KAK5095117.1 hypothetical protein LTS08_008279 [Lithohypha guttulata]